MAWAEPSHPEDVARLVRHCREEGFGLTPRGAGTGMPGGNLGGGVVMSLGEGFASIGAVDDAGLIRAGAGAVAGEIDARARAAGRFLPPLPSSGRWCTIGGMAACNAAGARSFRHGPTAAWIEELAGVDASGDAFRVGPGTEVPRSFAELDPGVAPGPDGQVPGWPGVRKNASGYALDRFLPHRDPVQLLVGSEGTLAVLTRLTVRLAPLPASRGVTLLPVRSAQEATALACLAPELGAVACEFLGRRFLDIAALDRHPDVGELARGALALFLIEFEGSAEEVEEGLAAAATAGRNLAGAGRATRDPESAARLWGIRHAASPTIAERAARGLVSTQFIEDTVVPPSRFGDHLEGLERILDRHRFDAIVFGHAGDANVHVNPLVDVGSVDWRDRMRSTLHAVTEQVASLGGTLTGEHGDGRVRAPFLDRIWGKELAGAFRRVKRALDPDSVLNPGVVIPLEGQDPLAGIVPRPRAWPAP